MAMNPMELFEFNKNFARRMLMERGSVSLMFVMHGRDGEVVPLLMGATESREQVYVAARLAAIAVDAVAVVVMSEAWLSRGSGQWDGVMPRDNPDRIEALVVVVNSCMDGGRTELVSAREIVRGEAGGVVDLRDVELPGNAIGALHELPPRERPTLEARLRARRALEQINVFVVTP